MESHSTSQVDSLTAAWPASAILSATADPFFVVDRSGIVRYVNPAGARALGVPADEVIGVTWHRLAGQTAAVAMLDAERHAVLTTGRPLTTSASPDGARGLRHEYGLSPLPGPDGQPEATVITMRPMADRAPAAETAWRHEALLDLAPIPVVVRRLDGVITFWNPAARHLYGWLETEVLGSTIHELLKTEFAEPLEQIERQLLNEGQWDGELRHTRRDGSVVTVASRWALERDATGQPTAIMEIYRDITQQRVAEQRFRTSVETMLDAVGIYSAVRDTDGRIVDFRIEYVNDAACRINQMSREQQVGRTLLELFPAHRENGLLDAYRRLVETGEPLAYEALDYEGQAGERRLRQAFAIHATRLDDGCIATWRDVTVQAQAEAERIQLLDRAEAARREAERTERRQTFLASASAELATSLDYTATLQKIARLAVPEIADWCVVDMLDEEGAIQIVAVAHPDPEHEALVRELRRRYPPDPDAQHGLPRVLRLGESVYYPVIEPAWRVAAARDNEHLRLMEALDAHSSLCVPLLARGRTLGAMTLVYATSGRQYSPADLALAEDLARRCALALDNAELYGQLQESLRSREAFLASAAHDLRNPLTTIRMITQGLHRRLHRTPSPEAEGQLEKLAMIDSAAKRMTAIINELLDVARLETGVGLELSLQSTDLIALVRTVVAEHQAATKRHTLQIETMEPELIGTWDAVRLERVLGNLLSNAIKYSHEQAPVTVEVAREQSWAVLRVRDQGVGIPAADIPRLFQRFQRGRNVKGRVAGTGLGLWGGHQIVEQHGGTITIESQEGVGTTAIVRLPLAPSQAADNTSIPAG